MNIRKNVVAGFAALFVLLAIPIGYSILSGIRIERNSSDIQNNIYPALVLTTQLIDMHKQINAPRRTGFIETLNGYDSSLLPYTE